MATSIWFEGPRALDLKEADTWATLSDIAVLAGRVEEDLAHIREAFRLNPFPASWYYLTLGQAQYAAGEYEAAVETLRRDETYRTSSRRFLAASLAQLGRLDEARAKVELFLVGKPAFHNPPPGRDGAIPRRLSISSMATARPAVPSDAPA